MAVETPPPGAPRAGADLTTDSSDLGIDIELPVWAADISTPSEDGNELVLGGLPQAPDAGMTRQPQGKGRHSWLRDNRPERMPQEPSEMGHLDVGAQVLRMCDAAADFLARGAFEVGTAAEPDRAGEPGMDELWPFGKSADEMFAEVINKAGARLREISKDPGKKVC